LAAEKGYPKILVLLLHSKYNDIAKTYLDTTPLEIAVWRNKMKCVQLLVQDENKLQKYLGNYHLFNILSIFCKVVCYRYSHTYLYPIQSLSGESSSHCYVHLLCATVDMVNDDDYDLVSDSLLYQFVHLYKILIHISTVYCCRKWPFWYC
jgi:hypothetical protein